MRQKILAVLAATILLFIWNAVSWMALPFHSQSLNTLPDQVVKFTELSSIQLEEGVYHYPGLPENSSPEAIKSLQQKLKDGPRVPLMVFKPGPSELFNPNDFLVSLLLNLSTVSVVLIILISTKSSGLKQTLANSALLGVLITVMSDLALMNWYQLPWSFVWPAIADHVVGLVLAGWILHIICLKKNYEKN
ncbi:hypothetical protein [Ekhidna sp.]|uniref:hypothetical protein n=1 Tax=Ekhidna sp. TaxID=2608089 RepID=UPI003512B992